MIVDIIYLDKKLILYIIDVTTTFQIRRFLNNMSTKETWETLY